MGKKQWVKEGSAFTATDAPRMERLPAGLYDIGYTMQQGTFLVKTTMRDDRIIRFPDSPTEVVIRDIESFWNSSDKFKSHGIPHKRGVLLHGPPGSGKSFTIQLLARELIDRDGIVLMWSRHFLAGYRLVRYVEPDRSIVVLMEDIDEILATAGETDVLNILDGAESMHRVVFVASTNYLEKLADRVKNRPSRFDRLVEIPHPSAEGRRLYLETLMRPEDDVDVEKWAKDTSGFSMAHLKELFVGVALLGNPYDVWLKQLRKMYEDKDRNSTDYSEFQRGVYA